MTKNVLNKRITKILSYTMYIKTSISNFYNKTDYIIRLVQQSTIDIEKNNFMETFLVVSEIC